MDATCKYVHLRRFMAPFAARLKVNCSSLVFAMLRWSTEALAELCSVCECSALHAVINYFRNRTEHVFISLAHQILGSFVTVFVLQYLYFFGFLLN